MVPVTIVLTAFDNCGAVTCRIVDVESNEPANGAGDGDSDSDWRITGELTLELRAERSGQGSGRIYGVVVECRDVHGNTSTKTVAVAVPHAQGK
jgi:hypothetical protein